MATTPDLHAGGPRFKSRCRPTNFGAHLPYTPPPGHKDASRVPKGMVYAKARDDKKINKCRLSFVEMNVIRMVFCHCWEFDYANGNPPVDVLLNNQIFFFKASVIRDIRSFPGQPQLRPRFAI